MMNNQTIDSTDEDEEETPQALFSTHRSLKRSKSFDEYLKGKEMA
jgi:hypothetical protein